MTVPILVNRRTSYIEFSTLFASHYSIIALHRVISKRALKAFSLIVVENAGSRVCLSPGNLRRLQRYIRRLLVDHQHPTSVTWNFINVLAITCTWLGGSQLESTDNFAFEQAVTMAFYQCMGMTFSIS